MRAVKSVLTAAGQLKQREPQTPEDELVLRALSDVNVPKFLSEDIPLFRGIISDLFPGVAPPSPDYGALRAAMVAACARRNLQPVEAFLQKCIELYETTLVRHGMMVVGDADAGKSSVLGVLADALNSLEGDPRYYKVQMTVCNPKAVTMGQLYGQFDEVSHEWTDGILANNIRKCARDTSPIHKWCGSPSPRHLALWC